MNNRNDFDTVHPQTVAGLEPLPVEANAQRRLQAEAETGLDAWFLPLLGRAFKGEL